MKQVPYLSVRFATGIILLLLFGGQTLGPVFATPKTLLAYTQSEKGLMIDDLNVRQSLPIPSFSSMKQAALTLVGTTLDHRFTASQLKSIENWIRSVKDAGFRTFLRLSTKMDPTTAASWVGRAVLMGADVVMLDELLGRYSATKKQLQTILNAGLKMNPSLAFIVTEHSVRDITNAYSWTSGYPSVRVATDDYYHKERIDVGIRLAHQYNKRPLVWLIFSQGSQNFDCYLNLDDWIAYVKGKGVDANFWKVDSKGIWQTQWQKVVSF